MKAKNPSRYRLYEHREKLTADENRCMNTRFLFNLIFYYHDQHQNIHIEQCYSKQ